MVDQALGEVIEVVVEVGGELAEVAPRRWRKGCIGFGLIGLAGLLIWMIWFS